MLAFFRILYYDKKAHSAEGNPCDLPGRKIK